MAKSKNFDSREYYNRESEGLRQRRLKEESRWRFNPNANYSSEEDDDLEDDVLDEEFDDDYR